MKEDDKAIIKLDSEGRIIFVGGVTTKKGFEELIRKVRELTRGA